MVVALIEAGVTITAICHRRRYDVARSAITIAPDAGDAWQRWIQIPAKSVDWVYA